MFQEIQNKVRIETRREERRCVVQYGWKASHDGNDLCPQAPLTVTSYPLDLALSAAILLKDEDALFSGGFHIIMPFSQRGVFDPHPDPYQTGEFRVPYANSGFVKVCQLSKPLVELP